MVLMHAPGLESGTQALMLSVSRTSCCYWVTLSIQIIAWTSSLWVKLSLTLNPHVSQGFWFSILGAQNICKCGGGLQPAQHTQDTHNCSVSIAAAITLVALAARVHLQLSATMTLHPSSC